MTLLKDKIAIISNCHDEVGKQTALTLAKNGYHIVIAGNNHTLPSVAECCRHYGVQAVFIECDFLKDSDIHHVVIETAKIFGKIDVLINASSVTVLTDTLETDMHAFDMMHQFNMRGTYLMSQACIPFLQVSGNGHIVNFAPPLVLNTQFFSGHLGYTMSKYGMSMCTLGMAHEFYHDNIAVNSLWSRTVIKAYATDDTHHDTHNEKFMRKPTIMADAVLDIIAKPTKVCTGCFLIDDLVLMAAGVTDFNQYAYEVGHPLVANLFLPHDLPPPPEGVIIQN